MGSAKDVIITWTSRLLANPDTAKKIGGIIKIVVEGAGGGSWLFDCTGAPRVEEGDGRADCTLWVGAEDLMRIDSGALNPQMAFVQGKIRLAGDMGLALKLSSVFVN